MYGLEYLHTRRIPICHGDLKSVGPSRSFRYLQPNERSMLQFNILVNSDFRAVITDFGSARVKAGLGEQDESASNACASGVTSASDISVALKVFFDVSNMEITLTGPKYTLRWAAPEVLAGQDPDLPSDIWALGWICWEVHAMQVPVVSMTDEYGLLGSDRKAPFLRCRNYGANSGQGHARNAPRSSRRSAIEPHNQSLQLDVGLLGLRPYSAA